MQEDLPSKCHLLGVPASSLHQLRSWAQPNPGCSRCQQIPGNEHRLYRGLPSPTSWRETQQPLKFILKYVGFTQKSFMALCSNTWAVWAQDNAQDDTGLWRLVHNLELLDWIFLTKAQKCPDSSRGQVSGLWIQKAKCLLVSSSSIWHCCQVGEGWLSPLERLQLGIQSFRGWGGRQRSWEGHSLGMRDFRTAGELPRVLSAPWFPFSSLQKCSPAHWSSLVFTLFQRLHPHSFIPHLIPVLAPSPPHPLSPSPITLSLLLAVLPISPKAGHSTLPFPIPLPRSELPICFPLSLCIISQSLPSHPGTVHMCFYTSQPGTADCFYFAGSHSELPPPCKSGPGL